MVGYDTYTFIGWLIFFFHFVPSSVNIYNSKQKENCWLLYIYCLYRVLVSFYKRVYIDIHLCILYSVMCSVYGIYTHFCLIAFLSFFSSLFYTFCCGRCVYSWLDTNADVECWTTRSGVTDGSFRLYPTIGHH